MNTWPIVSGAFGSKALEAVALLKEICHYGWALRLYSSPYFQFAVSVSCLCLAMQAPASLKLL